MDAVTLTAPRAKSPRAQGDVDALAALAKVDMAAVDALIIDRMQSPVPVIPLLAEHIIAAGGKRLRPLLTIAAARAAIWVRTPPTPHPASSTRSPGRAGTTAASRAASMPAR